MRPVAFTLAALLLVAAHAAAAPVGTAFTYQGQLLKSSSPYTGNADGIFRLYDAASGGSLVGSAITITSMSVTSGLFSVDLDFGGVFTGTALWLDIQVRTPPDAVYTTLTPRVRLAASPFAMYSLNAPAGGTSQWTNSPFGIEYTPGNVGLGLPGQQAHGGVKLYINTGTNNLNPLWAVNNNASYAALYTANSANSGYGWYDDQSDRHYVEGRLGLGTSAPDSRSKLQAIGGTVSIWGQATGNILATGYQCGVYGVGLRGTNQQLGFQDAIGVIGASDYSTGVAGITTNLGSGVTGQNNTSGTIGYVGGAVAAIQGNAVSSSGFGGYFANSSGGVALKAAGIAQVNTLQILGGADLAEPFDVASVDRSLPEAGTVVVIDAAKPGDLRVSAEAYDTRVAGIISGARGLAPGMVMRSEGGKLADGAHPVALTGRVWCKVDASYGSVRPGDLLTTSATPGHAMKASDPDRRAGAVIGKAMTALESGRGLVLVLVSLQ